MNEQIVRMGLMWILAGLSAGWLAETLIVRRGYGLIVDMGLGVGAGLAGGGVFLMVSGRPAGTLAMFVCAFVLAAGVIIAQRLFWARPPGARERNAHERLRDLRGTSGGLPGAGNGVSICGAGRLSLDAHRDVQEFAVTLDLQHGCVADLQPLDT